LQTFRPIGVVAPERGFLGMNNRTDHSRRSATSGSTFVARRAGTKQATNATKVSNSDKLFIRLSFEYTSWLIHLFNEIVNHG